MKYLRLKMIITLYMFFLSSIQVLSKNTYIGIMASYNSYHMDELRDMTNSVVMYYNSKGIRAKEFEKFAAYFSYQLEYIFQNNHQSCTGMLVGYSSTGSTIHYADYSGELRDDFLLSRYFIGILLENKITKKNWFQILICTKLFAVQSILDIESHLEIYHESQTQTISMKKWGCNIEPSLCVRITNFPYLLTLGIGYEQNIYHQFYGQDYSGEKYYASWNGFRFFLSMRFEI